MRHFSSGIKNNELIEAFRQVPQELRSAVSTLVTDQIFWKPAGSQKMYALPNGIKVYHHQNGNEHCLEFKEGAVSLHYTTIKKWPANWHDEAVDREKMKM